MHICRIAINRELNGAPCRDVDKESFKKLRAFERYEEEREEDDEDEDEEDNEEKEIDVEREKEREDTDKKEIFDGISDSKNTASSSSITRRPLGEWKIVTDILQIRKIVEFLGEGQHDPELAQNLVHSFLTEKKAEKEVVSNAKEVSSDGDEEEEALEPQTEGNRVEDEPNRPGRKVSAVTDYAAVQCGVV
jgi:hypothetical protein